MKVKFDDVPGWEFEIDEVSVGVYRATGIDAAGHRVALTGLDPDALLIECRAAAIDVTKVSENRQGTQR